MKNEEKMRHSFIRYLLLSAVLLLCFLSGCGRSTDSAKDSEDTISGDWRSQDIFTDPYVFSDSTEIYLVISDDWYSLYLHEIGDDGEPVYLCDLSMPEKYSFDREDMTGSAQVEDYDGDGVRDIGLVAEDGSVLWYSIDTDNAYCGFLSIQYADSADDDSGSTEDAAAKAYPEAMPEDFDLAVEDMDELVPDVLNLREKEYDDMPYLETQNELNEYVLWNLLWGQYKMECRLSWDLAYDLSSVALEKACKNAMTYYLFSSYNSWTMYTEDDGDPDSIYAVIEIRYTEEDLDLEARAEAQEYVMKNPVPIGGFTTYDEEMEYARAIHDYVACKVTYDPMGYSPETMNGSTHYENLQEAYNVLGEDQETAVCAGYARAFALIAQYAGINCTWVYGNETDTESHAWNVIYPCDGSEPVLVDVTWDDSESNDVPGQTEVSDRYFYIPLSIEYEHEADAEVADFMDYLNTP